MTNLQALRKTLVRGLPCYQPIQEFEVPRMVEAIEDALKLLDAIEAEQLSSAPVILDKHLADTILSLGAPLNRHFKTEDGLLNEHWTKWFVDLACRLDAGSNQ